MAFQKACALSELTDSVPLGVEVDGTELVLVKIDDDVFALADECSHGAVALSEGDVEGCTLECYLHGSKFDLRSGEPLNLPATEPVATYPTRTEGDEVLVDLSPSEEN